MPSESKRVIFVQIGANAAVATAKFIAAAITGSSGMLAEGFHSTVDTGDGLLLLLGRHLGARPPDPEHPFGYGLELYFWAFIVALMMFAVGGGMAIYEGITRLIHPGELEDATWSYIVLGAAALFDGISFTVALRKFMKEAGERSLWKALAMSKDPSVFTVLLEDSADLAGILLAFLGVLLSHQLGTSTADGIASIGIGLVLLTVSVFLGLQSRGLLTGERANPALIAGIHRLVTEDPAVQRASPPRTLQLGRDRVLLGLDVQFRPGLSASEVGEKIDQLEARIRARYPVVKHAYIEEQAADQWTDGRPPGSRRVTDSRAVPAPPSHRSS